MRKYFFALIAFFFMAMAGCIAQQSDLILENGSYFNGKIFVPFKELHIKDGKISSVSNVSTKDAGQRISVEGKYIIPGLIDAHEHISGSPTRPYVLTEHSDNLKTALHCGVTTVIDLFYPEDGCKELKQKVGASPKDYSSVLMSGPILTAPGGHGTEYGVPTRTMTTVAEATRITGEVIDNGADLIKVVYQAYSSEHTISKDVLNEIVRVAHKRNKKVFAHIDDAAEAMDCIDAGVDVLAHLPVDKLTDAQLSKIKRSGVPIIPTLTVYQALFEGFDARYMSDSLLWATVNPAYLAYFGHNALPKTPIPDSFYKKIFHSIDYRENLRNCIRMKIPLLAGTDAGNYAVFFGYSLHNEIQQYVKEGMSAADALCSATGNISIVFPGIKTGRISEGYDADIVVLGSDPLKNIENTEDIRMVIHKGKQVDLVTPIFKKQIDSSAKTAALNFDPTALKLDNMEMLPPYVVAYSDKVVGGTSELNFQLQKEDARHNHLHLAGKVIIKGYVGFTGVSFNLAKGTERPLPEVDISAYKAIEFDVKGNGEQYYVVMPSGLVKDFNYHSASFKADKEWNTVKIPFGELKQSAYFGKQVGFDPTTIKAIIFLAGYKNYDVDFDIKNIHLVK